MTANAPSDAELVARALAGQRQALATLVSRYERAAFHLALGVVGHREEALDVVQAALLKMIQSLDSLSRPERFGSWFLRIVRNKALDASSQRRRRNLSSLEGDPRGGHAGPLETLETSEAVSRLRDAMQKLNEDQRAVIAMRYGQDLDYATIARSLGIPVSTVRSRLYEARLILKAHFGCTGRSQGPRREKRAGEPQ